MAAPAHFRRPLAAAMHEALVDTPVICVLGARQVGKTTMVRDLVPRYRYFSLDDEAVLSFAREDPIGFVQTLPDRVILDEVQRAPALLRTIKLSVDRNRQPGRFVLTGSSNLLLLPQLGDSLAGRMASITLQPLTAAEQMNSRGRFLATFIADGLKPEIRETQAQDLQALASAVTVGGFPEAVVRRPERVRAWHRDYIRALMNRDVLDLARVRDTHEISRLMELLALRTGTLLNVTSLGKELALRRETVENYIGICERLYLVRRIQPWHSNSSKRLIKTPKVYVIDSGLAATLSDFDPHDLSAQRERFGHLLESYVVQQLVAQAGWTQPDLRFWHYRDKDQVEVDLVITLGRKVWGVEIKSSLTVSPTDGNGLQRLAEQSGSDFRGGVLLHAGASSFPLSTAKCLAVPMARVFDM